MARPPLTFDHIFKMGLQHCQVYTFSNVSLQFHFLGGIFHTFSSLLKYPVRPNPTSLSTNDLSIYLRK